MGVPISSANIERILTSLRVRDSGIAVSNDLERPSQFIKLPLFSTTAATGSTTFAISVIALFRISSETTNAFFNPSWWCAEISRGSTPPTRSASIFPSCRSLRIASVSRPSALGSASTPHAAWISTRACVSETGRPPGRRLPIAPASRAPRSPALRGIHATFAPELFAIAATAESAPCDSLNRSPTTITD